MAEVSLQSLEQAYPVEHGLKELLHFHGLIRLRIADLELIAEKSEDFSEAELKSRCSDLLHFFLGPFKWHDQDEEELLLPRLSATAHPPRLEVMLQRCRADHKAFDGLLDNLMDKMRLYATGSRPFDKAVVGKIASDLREMLEPHLSMEEQEIIPLARLLLSEDELREMNDEMVDRQAERQRKAGDFSS